MYSGVDFISNYTRPQSGVNVHQSMSNLTGSEGCACNHLLGKGCTTPDHDVFCSSIKHVNHNASHVKKQKFAMHVNTRHVGLHHQHGVLAPAQSLVNQFFSAQEAQPESSIRIQQSGMENAGNFSSKELDLSSQSAIGNTYTRDTVAANAQSTNNFVLDQNNSAVSFHANTPIPSSVVYASDGQISIINNASSKTKPTFTRQQKPCNIFLPKVPKKPSIISSKTVLPTPHSNHRVGVAASSNDQITVHMDTREIAHAGFLESVQRWTNGIKYICDARKQQLWYDLFGDEPTCTANAADLLKVLKHIDQKKNQITHAEEHATGLIDAISEVLRTCDKSTEEDSIMLARKILDNLLQRFRGVRFCEV